MKSNKVAKRVSEPKYKQSTATRVHKISWNAVHVHANERAFTMRAHASPKCEARAKHKFVPPLANKKEPIYYTTLNHNSLVLNPRATNQYCSLLSRVSVDKLFQQATQSAGFRVPDQRSKISSPAFSCGSIVSLHDRRSTKFLSPSLSFALSYVYRVTHRGRRHRYVRVQRQRST